MRRFSMMLAVTISASAHANAESPAVTAPAPVMATPALIAAPVGAMRKLVLDAGYTIEVNTVDLVTSKKTRVGDKVPLVTTIDVSKDGVVLIPRGTPGEGSVSMVKGTGAFGRSGKLTVTFSSLTMGGRTIMLNGQYEQDGDSNNGAMVGAIIGAGLIGGVLVTGHTAKLPPTQAMQARIIESQSFVVPMDASPAMAPMSAPAAIPAPAH